MDRRIIFAKDNNELYIELNIFYNIGLIILGLFAFLFNSFFSYIIWKEKLWKQSIQFVFQILTSISGTVLGLRDILVGIINLILLDSSISSYNFLVCKIKSSIDILILYVFELSFCFRMVNFTLLIGYPIFYKNHLERAKNNKYIIAIILFLAFTCDIFYILDINNTNDTKNCNVYSFMGLNYEHFFIALIIFLLLLSIPILIFGLYNVVKLKLNKTTKDNIVRLSNYYNFIYFIFLVLPFSIIIMSLFFKADKFLVGVFYDLTLFSVVVVAIVDFIFAMFYNKPIKDNTMKILKINSKISFMS
uniref:G_PROTEIN_RECEP_F1_2 domain-containing protein n=1 Tax=Strongyloides venezuelensis TaxID=75913 RepID=A0A0K0G5R8_STRVS